MEKLLRYDPNDIVFVEEERGLHVLKIIDRNGDVSAPLRSFNHGSQATEACELVKTLLATWLEV